MFTSPHGMSAAPTGPIRVQAVGLGLELATRLDEILSGAGGLTDVRDFRFLRHGRSADVLLVAEPERGSDLRELARSADAVRMIVIVQEASPSVVRRMVEAGAHGVLTQRELERTLIPALEAVSAGLVCLA